MRNTKILICLMLCACTMSKKTDAIDTTNLDASTMVYAIANQQKKETASDEKAKDFASAKQKQKMDAKQHMAEVNAMKNLTKNNFNPAHSLNNEGKTEARVAKNDINSAHSLNNEGKTGEKVTTMTTKVDDPVDFLEQSGFVDNTNNEWTPFQKYLEEKTEARFAKNGINSADSLNNEGNTGKKVTTMTTKVDDLENSSEDLSQSGYKDRNEWVNGSPSYDNSSEDLSQSGYKDGNEWVNGSPSYDNPSKDLNQSGFMDKINGKWTVDKKYDKQSGKQGS